MWSKWHHCVIQHHLRELIRALALGRAGWTLVRELMEERLDGPALAWLTAPTVPLKCLLRMRLEDRYRDYVHRSTENPLVTHVQ